MAGATLLLRSNAAMDSAAGSSLADAGRSASKLASYE
jgi:hypothetical protein